MRILAPAEQEPVSDYFITMSWQATLFLGTVTAILGLIVTLRPSTSLNVIAVLIGILMIISGIFHLIRMLDRGEAHRVWLGIAGLVFVIVGVVLIRHLNLTRALIGLFVGISWIIQGLSALSGGMGGSREGRGWWVFFGIISLIAGIVVVAAPLSSVTVLAVLLGIWFIVMGLLEIAGAFVIRRSVMAHSGPPRSAGQASAA